jgi:NNP family nitrate/nitrite transporter-like MFS transporter
LHRTVTRTALSILEAASGDSLISEAKGSKSGTYLLRWQVLALEPHRTYTSLLIAGSLPVMGVGLSHDYISFLTFRLEVAAIGASFLITQFHNSVMFGPNIVGTANATATGWATSAAA